MPDEPLPPDEQWLAPPPVESDDSAWRGDGAHPELPPAELYGPEYHAYKARAEQEEEEEQDAAIRRLMGDATAADPDDDSDREC